MFASEDFESDYRNGWVSLLFALAAFLQYIHLWSSIWQTIEVVEKEVERLLEVDATAEDVRYGNTPFALLQLIVKLLDCIAQHNIASLL